MGDKIYPIGIQNFEKIRNEGYYYVDKTALIYRLVKTGSYYFLSRPRRFGKSLLISTLEAYFLGKKELFEGLAMAQLEKNWIRRPVLHLDLNIGKYDTPDSLDKSPVQMGDYVRHRCRGDDPRPTLQGYRGTCQPAIRSAGSHPCR